MGMFGVNRGLRQRFPDLARGLLAGAEPLSMPVELRLRIALASGTTGRLTGAVHTHLVIGPTSTAGQLHLLSDASVYFPPLAWQLAGVGSTLLHDQGWADATGWLAVPLDETPMSRSFARRCPWCSTQRTTLRSLTAWCICSPKTLRR